MEKINEGEILKVIKESRLGISTTADIAEKLNLDRHTASKYLHILKSKGLIGCKSVGMTNLWYFVKSPLLNLLTSKDDVGKSIRNLLDEIDSGISVVDKDMKVIWTNKNISKSEDVNRHCYEAHAKRSDVCKDCPVEKTWATGEKNIGYNKIKDENGKEILYQFTTIPIKDMDNNTVAIMEVVKKNEK